MSEIAATLPERTAEPIPPLEAGDHLDQKTFHERYKAMPGNIRAELIGGIVYMPSPLKARHGESDIELGTWLTRYKAFTPGTSVLHNATTILNDANEPQPDAALRILPECGGQTRKNADGYIVGAPELTAEVALSSAAIDLHSKRREYEQTGVREYIVLVLRENRVVWFVRRGAEFRIARPRTGWNLALGILRRPLDGPGGYAARRHASRGGSLAARVGFAGASSVR